MWNRLIITMWTVFGCLTIMSFVPSEPARILAVELSGSMSHWNFMSSVARSLIAGGHELTIFTSFANMDGCRDNCTLVDTSKDFASFKARDLSFGSVVKSFSFITSFVKLASNITRMRCDSIYNNSDIRSMLQTADDRSVDFDVLLVNPMMGECASYLATMLRIPLIYLIPSTMVSFTEFQNFGNVPNPVVVSHVLSRHSVSNTFAKQFTNVVLTMYGQILWLYYEWMAKQSHPRVYDSVALIKPSIVFVNSHSVTERSRPLPSNFIPIGGVHLRRQTTIPIVSVLHTYC